jgi:hypothetical protein
VHIQGRALVTTTVELKDGFLGASLALKNRARREVRSVRDDSDALQRPESDQKRGEFGLVDLPRKALDPNRGARFRDDRRVDGGRGNFRDLGRLLVLKHLQVVRHQFELRARRGESLPELGEGEVVERRWPCGVTKFVF